MGDAPPPGEAKLQVAQAFSRAAATYDQVISFFAPFGRALARAAALRPGERVLDVACGRGASLYPALDAVRPGGSVVGIDLAHGMVEALTSQLLAAGVADAEVAKGDAEDLAVPDASFDAVLGGFMIFFAPDPPKVLAELHRVTRPGGRVALSIFDGPPSWPWQGELVRELMGPPPARPSEEFNKAAVLVPALEAAGFDAPTGNDVVERFVFESVESVEAWQRSHAGRLLLDGFDDLQMERYRALLAERLEDHRVAGGFELVQRARMVVAVKPT
ncbi:MAG: class I SAM-dependent methyltransferase [Acidimicrobiales bacterium]